MGSPYSKKYKHEAHMLNSQYLTATTHMNMSENKVIQIGTYELTALHINWTLEIIIM